MERRKQRLCGELVDTMEERAGESDRNYAVPDPPLTRGIHQVLCTRLSGNTKKIKMYTPKANINRCGKRKFYHEICYQIYNIMDWNGNDRK